MAKRIISCFIAVVLCLSSAITPIFAEDNSSTVGNYIVAGFADLTLNTLLVAGGGAAGALFGQPQLGTLAGAALATGISSVSDWYAAGHTDQEIYDAFNEYNAALESDLGTSQITDSGIRVYFTPSSVSTSPDGAAISSPYTATDFSLNFSLGFVSSFGYVNNRTSSMTGSVMIYPRFESGFPVQFNCTYSTHLVFSREVGVFSQVGNVYTSASASADSIIYPLTASTFSGVPIRYCTYKCTYKSSGSLSLSAYADIVPSSGTVSNYTTNNITVYSRPTSITAPVGYYGGSDNNTLIVVNDVVIFDEDTKIFHNPVSGTTATVTNWSYDYSTRTYTLTLESGDIVTVTYGNENITIVENGITYTVYYLVVNDSGGGTGGTVCDHSYTSAVTREPTCTDAGVRTYTCTKCGHTYTELIDALGHDWTVTSHVDPVLDAEGNVVEEGYDELTCSRCGAVSRDYGDGPVDDDIFNALGDLIAHGIAWILGKLTELADSLHGITDIFNGFTEKVQVMAGEYPAFFAAFMALIPEDLSTVLWFGVVAFVVVSVWKRFNK
ncbi:MAG: hypothetical protein VB071_14395 [Lawsonibacter sp.]|nr:hypothetical protein [Lawsonibacter sp.]